jgi:hypothetical protein
MTWADVKKRDIVELNGHEWTVEKLVEKKKTVVVSLVSKKGRTAEGQPQKTSRVKIVGRVSKSKRGPLLDERGQAQRWATKKEAAEVGVTLKPGDAAQTKPPAKAKGGSWEKPRGDAEKLVADLMGARLVGEATDEARGYYVPPVDVSTVAAHLALFHGGIPSACEDEGAMLAAHTAQHSEARNGSPLAVNHWHTKERP